MPRKTGEIWTNESGNTCVMLHTGLRDDPGVKTHFQITARIDDESVMLAQQDGRTFMLTQKEALLLVKAINKHWPLDALGAV